MEAHNENENALLAILKAKQNHEEYDESKLLQLLQQIHSSNQSQISHLQQEIDKIDNINKLCNLTLQIKMLQYMRQNSPTNPLFSNLLNSWSINTIPQWTIISQNLDRELTKTNISQIDMQTVNNLITELIGAMAESMYKVDTESPQKFFSSQVLPLFYSGHHKRKGTEVENDLEIVQMDTTQVLGEEEGQTIDDFIQSLLSIQENIENNISAKLLNLPSGDLDKEDQILNTIYLTLSISQFEEKFKEIENKRMEKRSAKLKVSYDSDEAFLTELENSLKEIKDDFNHFLQYIQLSRDFFPIHLQERIGNSYSPFITELLLKHLTKMDYPNLIKLTNKLYGFYESLLDGILNICEPGSLAETRTLQEILEAPVTEHLSLVTPNILVYLQSDSQIYIAQASQRLQATLQDRIKFFEANQSLQDDTKLKNIDLDPKAANFLNEYNLAEEIAGNMNQDNQALIQHINEDINLVQNAPVKPKNTDQFLSVSRAMFNSESPQKPQGGFSLDVTPLLGSNNQPDPQNIPDASNNIPFFELTRYSASASIPLSELIRSPEYISQILDKHGLEILREFRDLNLIKDFQPARISKTLLKYLNDIDSFPEILVKFQKLTGGQKNYLDVFVEFLIRTSNKLQRKLEVFFELDRPDCLLYLSDWSFLNYRITQFISIANLLEPKGEAFSDEDISTFKERFSLAGNFNLKYLEKKYLEKYNLLVYSAIESEEWRSYRPFISSEIDEVFLRKEVTKMSKLSSLIQKSHIKSINYGLRMWKLLLKRNIGELTTYFGYPNTNLYGIKTICTLITETVSSIYLKYKTIEPSRSRNLQYINDLKFFVDCAEQHMRIIFGMILIRMSHESPDDRKIMTGLKYFLIGSLNSLWWNIKSAKCFLALLDIRPEILAGFLKECNNDQIALAIYPENHLNEMLKMSQYLYTEAVNINKPEIQGEKEGGDVNLFKNIQGKLQALLDRLAILAQCKNELTLSQLYEKFDLKMETLSTIELQNVEGGIEANMPKNINTATSKGFRDSTMQAFSKQREEVLDLEEAIKELFTSNANPMIKYGQSLFLQGNDVVSSEVMKNILGTMIFSPEHILFIIRKRIEYTFDEFPLLTEENKQAQRILNPLLEEFCQKFKIKMFDIPST